MQVPTINGKPVSYQMMYTVIGKRFHECLEKESKARPTLADDISDAELVHTVCRKERLTLFNFLMEHQHDYELYKEEQIKGMINKEYGMYFRERNQPKGMTRVVDVYGDARSFNPF